jgi:hypothetical protein
MAERIQQSGDRKKKSNKKSRPRARDGTLQEVQLTPETNWYGEIDAPQEEYIDSGVREADFPNGEEVGDVELEHEVSKASMVVSVEDDPLSYRTTAP